MVWPPVGEGAARHRVGARRRRHPEELRGQAVHVRPHPRVLPGGDGRHRSRRPTGGTTTRRTTADLPSCCRVTRSPAPSTPRSRPAGDHRTAASSSTSRPVVRRSSSASGCRRCTTSSRSWPTSTSPPSRWRSARPATTRWAASRSTPTPSRPSSPACTPSASARAACTAPTGWAATRSPTCSCSAAGPATRQRRTPRAWRSGPRSPTRRRRGPPRAAALAPFEVEGGENPYTIQQDLQQAMNDLVGIIRTAPELEEALAEIEALKAAGAADGRRGPPAVQPRLAPRARPAQHAAGRGVRSPRPRSPGRSRVAATPATTSRGPTRSGAARTSCVRLNADGTGVDLTEQPSRRCPTS